MATLSLPHSLTNGTTAYGSEVRGNDDAIVSFVNASVVHADGAVAMTGALTLPSGTPTTSQAVRRDYMETVVGGAWTTYTPTWTASTGSVSLGNGTLAGRYRNVNKYYDINIQLSIGSTTSFAGSGIWRFSTPTGFTTVSFLALHSGAVITAGGTLKQVSAYTNGNAYIECLSDAGYTTGSAPVAWATGDTLTLTLRGVESA